MEAFRQGLREAGLVEGRDVIIELRYAQGGLQQLSELAAELVRLKVDVIHASGDLAPRVAQQATGTIPIVAISDDILGAGLITSLSRPGGTTTGLTILSPELSAKRLEVLRDIIPGLSRVASLWDPTTGKSQVTLTQSAAQSLNIKLQMLEVRRRDDLAPRRHRLLLSRLPHAGRCLATGVLDLARGDPADHDGGADHSAGRRSPRGPRGITYLCLEFCGRRDDY
jgi:putative ABC transport system substrate-binding protein